VLGSPCLDQTLDDMIERLKDNIEVKDLTLGHPTTLIFIFHLISLALVLSPLLLAMLDFI